MLTQHSITSHTFIHSASSMLSRKRNATQQDQESPSFNLDRVLRQFATQPELLELILSSKVEEDRRRAEEAKLKQKEIDYVIQQQKKKDSKDSITTYATKRRLSSRLDQHQQQKQLPSISPVSPHQASMPSSSPLSSLPVSTYPSTSSTSSSSSSSASSTRSPNQKQLSSPSIEWHSSSIILPPLTSSLSSPSPTLFKHTTRPASPKRLSDDDDEKQSPVMDHQPHPQAPPSPPNEPLSTTTTKRRRREMQAITTIIETREFPYNDDYLWRNNGNTIHRKSGNKSIYYKCANSQQGCPVNKTCTLRQETGEYLIKYRGTHLPDCSTIKRINEV